MNRIRLAFSILTLVMVLTFGLTLTSRLARADQRLPECECVGTQPSPFSGLSCDSDGRRNPLGFFCCAMECHDIAE